MDEEQIEQRLIVGVGGDANVSWHQSRNTPASRFKADVHQKVISG